MTVLSIAGLALRRLFRDRSNIFWVIVAPLLFVFVLGVMFGGGQPLSLGVVATDDPTAVRITDSLAADERISVTNVDDPDQLRLQVERGMVHAGLVFPPDIDATLSQGEHVAVRYLTRPQDPFGADLSILVQAALTQQAQPVRAAQVATDAGAGTYTDNLQLARELAVPGVQVNTDTIGEAPFPDGISQFAPLAPSMLLLYVFLTSLTAALALIEARRLGVTRRIFASPTSTGTIVAGETLGRFAIALLQGLIVVVGSALLFGVHWGDPLGAGALLVLFCLVGAGAGMLLGSLVTSEGPALGVALGLGLGLAALGGAMVPLEQLGDTAQTIARVTPHAWGYEGFAQLVRHGGDITDILPQLGVLALMATVLLIAGAWQLRRALTR